MTILFRVSIFAVLLLSMLTTTKPATAQSDNNEALRGVEADSFPSRFGPGVTCSPAPCVLAPALASEGTGWVVYAPVTASPRDPRDLIVGSAEYPNCGLLTQLGFHVSSDAGATWSTTCMGQLYAFGQLWNPGDLPMVSYDLNGNAYIAGYYQYCQDNGSNCYSVVGMEKSSDGIVWNSPVTALGNATSEIFWASLAVDQSTGSPYANSIYFFGVNLGVSSQLLVSYSRDGGSTWKVSLVAAEQLHSFAMDYNPSITVGADGTVYLAWMHCANGPTGDCSPNSIEDVAFSKSSDGGVTWSKPKPIAKVAEMPNPNGCMCYPFGPIPNTNVYAPNTPALGIDNSNGPYVGRLYAVMFDWTGTYMRVQVIHSSDGGTTWSKPVPVVPSSDTHDQFFPWLSVSPTGFLAVSWLDRRNDPANVNYQAYAAISSNGGASFQPNIQLTTAFSNPNNYGNSSLGLGRYSGNTWNGPNYFIAAWMDTSNGTSSQDYVGGIRLH